MGVYPVEAPVVSSYRPGRYLTQNRLNGKWRLIYSRTPIGLIVRTKLEVPCKITYKKSFRRFAAPAAAGQPDDVDRTIANE
jgi:hypothetical protein